MPASIISLHLPTNLKQLKELLLSPQLRSGTTAREKDDISTETQPLEEIHHRQEDEGQPLDMDAHNRQENPKSDAEGTSNALVTRHLEPLLHVKTDLID